MGSRGSWWLIGQVLRQTRTSAKRPVNARPTRQAIHPRKANDGRNSCDVAIKLNVMLLRRPTPIVLVAVLLAATAVAWPASKTTNKETTHLDKLIEDREYPELERVLPQAKL